MFGAARISKALSGPSKALSLPSSQVPAGRWSGKRSQNRKSTELRSHGSHPHVEVFPKRRSVEQGIPAVLGRKFLVKAMTQMNHIPQMHGRDPNLKRHVVATPILIGNAC